MLACRATDQGTDNPKWDNTRQKRKATTNKFRKNKPKRIGNKLEGICINFPTKSCGPENQTIKASKEAAINSIKILIIIFISNNNNDGNYFC
jgi:hypothetical protein